MNLIVGESTCERGCCTYLGRHEDKHYWYRIGDCVFQTSPLDSNSGNVWVTEAELPSHIYANYVAWRLSDKT